MNKKILLLMFLAAGMFHEVFAQDYWLRVPSPTTRWLTRSCFVDTVFGWAAGDSGTIIHTSNSGTNWVVQNSGITDYPIDDIFFVNRRYGWALANDYLFQGTFVLTTTNGGSNWSVSRFSDTDAVLGTIYFRDTLNGFASGFTGNIFRTTNGGINWLESHVDTNYCPFLFRFPKNRFDFFDAQTGYACGGHFDIQGIIWKTTDSGANWFTYCVTPEPLYDIKAISSSKIISCGGDFEYGGITATSFNGGNSWIYDTTGIFGIARDLAFRTPSELWLPLSFAQVWGVSLDSGGIQSQWHMIPAPDTTSIYAAEFVSPTLGWGFGSNGAIVKYNASVIGLPWNGTSVPLKHMLNQNYPNPFNPSTTISYYLAKPEFVKITLYDLLGRQLKVIAEGIKPPGNNKFVFQNYGLASGVYIYKLEAGSFTESRKMVLVK
jgi:photosystem II stability/assembly factor-like uncharacterized protein